MKSAIVSKHLSFLLFALAFLCLSQFGIGISSRYVLAEESGNLQNTNENTPTNKISPKKQQLVKVGLGQKSSFFVEAPWGIDYGFGKGNNLYIKPINQSSLQVTDKSGRLLLQTNTSLHLRALNKGKVGANYPVTVKTGNTLLGSYRGSITFSADNNLLTCVNRLDLESYLRGVLPGEVPDTFHKEALKAMAVIARTYTLASLGRHEDQGYDLCPNVHCQMYKGSGFENPKTDQQIKATKDLVLFFDNVIADTRYHAVCAGQGESIECVWPSSKPVAYLKALPDSISGLSWLGDEKPELLGSYYDSFNCETQFRTFIDHPLPSYCQSVSRFRWTETYTVDEFSQLIKQSLPTLIGADPKLIGTVEDLQVTKRSLGGRAAVLSIDTDIDTFEVTKDNIRWITSQGKIGSKGLKSTLFYVDLDEETDTITFTGGGWGHGVGLCQVGAQGRSLSGQTFRQIIEHYYPGTVLKEWNAQ